MEKNRVKGIFIGKDNVGKTSIINTYINKTYYEEKIPTIGASFFSIKCSNFILDLWDTAGQEKYDSLIPMYYRNANFVFMVFDITCRTSICFCNIKIKEIKKEIPYSTIILLGNKYDLYTPYYDDNILFARKISEEYGIELMFVSAKDNLNISKILKKVFIDNNQTDEKTHLLNFDDEKKNCCVLN